MSEQTQKEALDGQYPLSWDEFVGQKDAIRQLKVKIAASKRRDVMLGHVLLASPHAGIGKTALSLLIARELDTHVWVISGAPKPHELRILFSQMEDGDILFIDEIHKLADRGGKNAEWLLHYLENGVIMGPLGPEAAPKVTVIGATTDAGKLPRPVLERFEIQPTLVAYDQVESAEIAQRLAQKILVTEDLPGLSDDTALAIAEAGSNRPRWMRRIIMAVRDLALAEEIEIRDDGKYDLDEALSFVGVTADGLTSQAQAYLRVMYTELGGQPAGAALLAERIGEVGTGLQAVESLLLDKGLVTKTKAGRVLTAAGIKRARQLTPSEGPVDVRRPRGADGAGVRATEDCQRTGHPGRPRGQGPQGSRDHVHVHVGPDREAGPRTGRFTGRADLDHHRGRSVQR
jgi:Holliday junction DNA helicase RuvB